VFGERNDEPHLAADVNRADNQDSRSQSSGHRYRRDGDENGKDDNGMHLGCVGQVRRCELCVVGFSFKSERIIALIIKN
jgi:hypothetical protein